MRIWFRKTGTAKFISHLDLCRCMERAIHKAKLPFWYTEGYNPHVFMTITMPISLGYSGLRESMDVKLVEEAFPLQNIIDGLNAGLPPDIRVTAVTEAIMKPGDLAFSSYEIYLQNLPGLWDAVHSLLEQDVITVAKKSKKGMHPVDIKPDFTKMTVVVQEDGRLKFCVTLASSHLGSINPRLFFDVLSTQYGEKLYPETFRTGCYGGDMQAFA